MPNYHNQLHEHREENPLHPSDISRAPFIQRTTARDASPSGDDAGARASSRFPRLHSLPVRAILDLAVYGDGCLSCSGGDVHTSVSECRDRNTQPGLAACRLRVNFSHSSRPLAPSSPQGPSMHYNATAQPLLPSPSLPPPPPPPTIIEAFRGRTRCGVHSASSRVELGYQGWPGAAGWRGILEPCQHAL